MILRDGDNPARVHCRVCGADCVPPYPGYQKDAVCSKECFDEFKWRETLWIMRKPYRSKVGPDPISGRAVAADPQEK